MKKLDRRSFMREEKAGVGGTAGKVFIIQRIVVLAAVVAMFFPQFNPARICGLVDGNLSLFTSAVSYASLTDGSARALRMGWMDESVFIVAFVGSLVAFIGILCGVVGICMSMGNLKLQRLSLFSSIGSGVLEIAGLVLCFISYTMAKGANDVEKVDPSFPMGIVVFGIIAVLVIAISIALLVMMPKPEAGMKYDMESKYKLFLMFLPFAALAFIFCYLPLWGWRYAFFDYRSGGALTMDKFVGFKWFTYLFQNAATRKEMISVLTNTLGMSAINIATSWLPMMFAVFLCEMKNMRFRRFVQTFTTVPNFISWVLVYALAIAIFSTDGFINTFAQSIGVLKEGETGKNYLMGDSMVWIKMWLWGTWKGIGWSAIIYIAGISGIDQQLYEAAMIDGAGRFQRMWHITLPGLMPTFFVLLLMSIANILSNGLDQYLVFENANNHDKIQVLDLYVYKLGINGGSIPLSTVVGMLKSVISVVLLFAANSASKMIRGESII